MKTWLHVQCSLGCLLALTGARPASAQCYQFSSGTAASLTLNITNLPVPVVSTDAYGNVTHAYNLANLTGNTVTLSVGNISLTSSAPPGFGISIDSGLSTGISISVAFLNADESGGGAIVALGGLGNLLPNGLPPALPPIASFQDLNVLAVGLLPSSSSTSFQGSIDAIRTCSSPPPTQSAKILFAGNDITGTTQSVYAGQQITLSASLPEGAVLAAQPWSVEGTTVGDFKVQPSPSEPISGKTTAADFSQMSTVFYWVAPGYFQAALSGTLGGQTFSAKATFNVDGPGGTNVNTQLGKITIVNGRLSFGDLTASPPQPGIVFTATSNLPISNTGTYQWVQLIDDDLMVATTSTGAQVLCTNVMGGELDNDYPYEREENPISDTPSYPLNDIFSALNRTFIAHMYLMWDPTLPIGCVPDSRLPSLHTSSICTSIPVPLGYVVWQVNTGANQDILTHQWTASGSADANNFQPSIAYAQWSDYVKNDWPPCTDSTRRQPLPRPKKAQGVMQ